MPVRVCPFGQAVVPPENLSEDELRDFEARAKEYSRRKMAQHRAWQTDINDKIRHKRAAVEALPEGYLRDAAALEDLAMFPLKRPTPQATPRVEGYYEEKQRKAEEAVTASGTNDRGAGGGGSKAH